MSAVPHLVTSYVELSGPGMVVLANNTNISLTHTLDPVLSSNAGQYICRAVLEIEVLNVPLALQSSVHTLAVRSKYNIQYYQFCVYTCNYSLHHYSALSDRPCMYDIH